MPVRSLKSPVLIWPRADLVDTAVRNWAVRIAASRSEAVRIGCFGSYARGDAGVGSDLDIIVVVTSADPRFEHRSRGWETTSLPVPVDLLVYTCEEFEKVRGTTCFGRTLERDTVWIWTRQEPAGA
jgi:predicted nucleotidyltransferase